MRCSFASTQINIWNRSYHDNTTSGSGRLMLPREKTVTGYYEVYDVNWQNCFLATAA